MIFFKLLFKLLWLLPLYMTLQHSLGAKTLSHYHELHDPNYCYKQFVATQYLGILLDSVSLPT